MERRILQLTNVEVRAAAGDAPSLIRGYAAVFNQLSVMLYGQFREKIQPGTFAQTIVENDIRCLWNHNDDLVLGRNQNGTLRLSEDANGLFMEVEPPNTQAGRDALTLIQRGDVNQQSFMFDVLDDDWMIDDNEQVIRTLKKVRLYEVSPVTFPAWPQTSAEARGENKLDVPPALPRWVAERNHGGKYRFEQAQREQRLRRIL